MKITEEQTADSPEGDAHQVKSPDAAFPADAVVPISTSNVRRHAALLASERLPRRTPHEDCCGYCDRYCQGKITNSKQRDIEAWRQDVHRAAKPRLRFLRSSSPPRPMRSPDGFMRVASVEGPISSSRDSSGRLLRRPWTESGRGIFGSREEAGSGVGEETPRSKGSSRTCSNELLNVITIDDASRSRRQQVLHSCAPPTTRTGSRVSIHLAAASMSTITSKRRSHSAQELHPKSGTSRVGASRNALVAAVDKAIASQHVIHNTAHRGLFKFERTVVSGVKEPSQRFQRLNAQLHRLMERQVLGNSPLCQRIQGNSPEPMGSRPLRAANSSEFSSMEGRLTTSRLMTPGKENFLEMLMELESKPDDSQ